MIMSFFRHIVDNSACFLETFTFTEIMIVLLYSLGVDSTTVLTGVTLQ